MPASDTTTHTIDLEGDGQGAALPTATAPGEVPEKAALDHPHLYFNRELSWLDFAWRVLYQALDERTNRLCRRRICGPTLKSPHQVL